MTIGNVRLVSPNEADAATLTASPAMVSTLPVTNLQDQARARVARTVGLPTPQYIYGNWSAVKQISAMALVRHNLTGAATLRLRLYAGNNQTGAVLYDSGAVQLGTTYPWGSFAWGTVPWGASIFREWPVAFYVFWFTAVGALSCELQMTDAANAAGYMEASRLFLGLYFEPAKNMSFGATMSWQEQSEQERSDGGTLRTDAKESYRRWEFDLSLLTQGERATLANIARRAGLRNDLFLSCYPGEGAELERDFAGLAKIVSAPGIAHRAATIWRTDRLVMEEA